jgi:integrase
MPLKLYLRNETWHYRGTVAGRRLRGSTGVSRQNKETAQHVIAELEARAWKGSLNPGSVLTFAQASLLYRAANKPTRFLTAVEDHWRDTPVKQITGGAIRVSCQALYPTAKAATWNRAVIVPTQAIINHAAEQELCPKITVKRWPVKKTTRQAVTWEWVKAFTSTSTLHLGGLALFMFLTGARIGESIALRWRDVDLTRCCALIRQTKTNTVRSAHLPNELIIALANIPGERHPEAKVFGFSNTRTPDRQWRETVRRAGLEPLTPHCCRHGFATGLLRAGVDVVTVAKLGGWKSPAQVLTTYGHASEDHTLTDVLTQNMNTPQPKSLKIKRV